MTSPKSIAPAMTRAFYFMLIMPWSATASARTGSSSEQSKIWEDRGQLTAAQVYWGGASRFSDPLTRLPTAPFSKFEIDNTANADSPKARVTDSRGVKWTMKFGPEVHADIAAPRLAWALGFGTDESYYIPSGIINGLTAQTDLGHAKGQIKPNGSFTSARLKRHDKIVKHATDAAGNDLTWDEGQNPGVPPQHLSGLLIFDVIVANWDTRPDNCKVLAALGSGGPEHWYIMSDMGGSLGGRGSSWRLDAYRRQPNVIRSVNSEFVELEYWDADRRRSGVHRRVPLSHAQWFRKQLERLTDDEIRAAFDAAYATDALNRAYLSADTSRLKDVREHELSPESRLEIDGFAAHFRTRINEFLQKVPAGP